MQLNIRWSKVSIVTVAVAGILSVTFIVPLAIDQVRDYRAAQLHSHPVSDTEQLEVLRAVLKDDFFTSWQLPPPPPPPPLPPEPYEDKSIVLIGSSIGVCKKARAIDRVEFGCIPAWDLERDTEFVQDEPGIPQNCYRNCLPQIRCRRSFQIRAAQIFFIGPERSWKDCSLPPIG